MAKKRSKKNTEVAVAVAEKPNTQVSKIYDTKNVKEVLDFAVVLKRFIVEKELSCKIQKKDYVMVDGWKFAGLNFGLVAEVKEPVQMECGDLHVIYAKKSGSNGEYTAIVAVTEIEKEAANLQKVFGTKYQYTRVIKGYKYKCQCDILNSVTKEKVGAGFAICTNAEMNKVSFDEYAILSMAQTRCIGKGFKNLIGYIMTAAGFQATPAEEMPTANKMEAEVIMEDWEFAVLATTDEASIREVWNKNPDLHNNKRFCAIVKQQKAKLKIK